MSSNGMGELDRNRDRYPFSRPRNDADCSSGAGRFGEGVRSGASVANPAEPPHRAIASASSRPGTDMPINPAQPRPRPGIMQVAERATNDKRRSRRQTRLRNSIAAPADRVSLQTIEESVANSSDALASSSDFQTVFKTEGMSGSGLPVHSNGIAVREADESNIRSHKHGGYGIHSYSAFSPDRRRNQARKTYLKNRSATSPAVVTEQEPQNEENSFASGVNRPEVPAEPMEIDDHDAHDTSVITGEQPHVPLAVPVRDSSIREPPEDVPLAEELPPPTEKELKDIRAVKRKQYLKMAICFFCACVVIVAIVAGSVLGTRSSDEDDGNDTVDPYSPRANATRAFLAADDVSGSIVMEEGTPQFLAAEWVAYLDPLLLDISVTPEHVVRQRYVLALLYYHSTDPFGSATWNNCNPPTSEEEDEFCSEGDEPSARWLSPLGECGWFGVNCTDGGEVSRVDVANLGLVSSIPSEIGLLTMLRELDFSSNEMTGAIPEDLFSLRELTSLSLESMPLSGTISTRMGDLLNLQSIRIGGTSRITNALRISGSIPTEIGKLSSLTDLAIYRLSTSGIIPGELYSLTELVSIDLSNLRLRGTLSTEVGQLTNLQLLDIAGNTLGRRITSEIGNCPLLRMFNIDDNGFTGPFPNEIGQLAQLEIFSVSSNPIGGAIPTTIYQLTSLKSLNLANTGLTGSIGTRIGELINMQQLNLGVNSRLVGSIPSEIGLMTSILQLQLQATGVSGTIPDELYDLVLMDELRLNSNPSLTGTISTLIGRMTSLRIVQMSSDVGIIGSIPEELYNARFIVEMNMGFMGLTGTLSTQFGRLTGLGTIVLQDNNLSGNIPSEIGIASSLRNIRVQNNKFVGEVPQEICARKVSGTTIVLEADCSTDYGDRIECECCTNCCNPSTGVCRPQV